ncbi:hypothetical protein Pyn_03615 [Prunus yedoensis var. nudiflora]|uniref:Uncharacterized protein n=1 Tax=Prunus yedoensis var. nudiflora TaxID=2094558 RepID=A0A314Z452_PRUYE|nr:hypothetical protein Pyn_03615 [Prunus yedoensis var. nudiflora]
MPNVFSVTLEHGCNFLLHLFLDPIAANEESSGQSGWFCVLLPLSSGAGGGPNGCNQMCLPVARFQDLQDHGSLRCGQEALEETCSICLVEFERRRMW